MKKIFSNVCVIISFEIYNSSSENSLIKKHQLSEICLGTGLQMQVLEGDICSLRGDWDSINKAHDMILHTISLSGQSAHEISRSDEAELEKCENTVLQKVNDSSSSKDIPDPIIISSQTLQVEYNKENAREDISLNIFKNAEHETPSYSSIDETKLGIPNKLFAGNNCEDVQEDRCMFTHTENKNKCFVNKAKSKSEIFSKNKSEGISLKKKIVKNRKSQNSSRGKEESYKKEEVLDCDGEIMNTKEEIDYSVENVEENDQNQRKINDLSCKDSKNGDFQDTVKKNTIQTSTSEVIVEYKCGYCELTFPLQDDLLKHTKKKHRKEKTYYCEECKKFFYNHYAYVRHSRTHGSAQHVCDVCGKAYKGYQTFLSHKQSHEKNYKKPEYKCQYEDCSKTFSTKYVLNNHIKSQHMGIKRTYLCPTCGKSFTQKNSYIQHANVHLGVKPFTCNVCGKSFSYEKSLKDHRYIHEETRRFKCEVCGKSFKQSSAVSIHMKVHSESKDHLCNICGKGFTQKQALYRHERIHTGEKPYSCSFCHKKFSDTSIIRRHLILVHQSDPKQWREAVITESSNKNGYFVEYFESQSKKKGRQSDTASSKKRKKVLEVSDVNQTEEDQNNIDGNTATQSNNDVVMETSVTESSNEMGDYVIDSVSPFSSTIEQTENVVVHEFPGMMPQSIPHIATEYLPKSPSSMLHIAKENDSQGQTTLPSGIVSSNIISATVYQVPESISSATNADNTDDFCLTSLSPVDSVVGRHIKAEEAVETPACTDPTSLDQKMLGKDAMIKTSSHIPTLIVMTQPFEDYSDSH